jgi:hypothetical protein
MPSWLARVRSWLPGGQPVSAPCPQGGKEPVLEVWSPPAVPRNVPAMLQAQAIIEALQDEGVTGVVPRVEILDRYAEHCWMLGFKPIGTNALCEALREVCGGPKATPRIIVNGKKVTAYRIPDPTETPWPPLPSNVSPFPSGNKTANSGPKHRQSARSGSSHAQA